MSTIEALNLESPGTGGQDELRHSDRVRGNLHLNSSEKPCPTPCQGTKAGATPVIPYHCGLWRNSYSWFFVPFYINLPIKFHRWSQRSCLTYSPTSPSINRVPGLWRSLVLLIKTNDGINYRVQQPVLSLEPQQFCGQVGTEARWLDQKWMRGLNDPPSSRSVFMGGPSVQR